jgi:hypothetical protein
MHGGGWGAGGGARPLPRGVGGGGVVGRSLVGGGGGGGQGACRIPTEWISMITQDDWRGVTRVCGEDRVRRMVGR